MKKKTKMSERGQEKMFKAAANRRRLRILRYLRKEGKKNVGEIAGVIGVSTSSTSKHLIDLSKANFVEEEKRGFYVEYRIHSNPHPFIRYILDNI